MKWSDARDRTLRAWASVQDSIGDGNVTELLREINVMTDLCEKAAEEAHGGSRCAYCLAYKQFGGCYDITARLSHHVAEKDWDKVRELAQVFMERLRSISVPAAE